MNIKLVFVLFLGLLLSGCLKTRSELRGDEDNGELRRQTNTQRSLEQKPPPPAPKADEYDDQMRQLNGRVDGVENEVKQIASAHAAEKESVTKMAQAIDQKFTAYEEAIKKLEEQVAALNDQINKKSEVAPSVGSGTKSKTAFDEGEDSFNAKRWKEAIVNYQKYRDSSPKGKMYAESTYKIGLCFQELKMKDEAKSFFDEVIAKFPGSKEAKKAAFRAKQLK